MQIGSYLGRYEILDRLGGGGMADIYRARDTKLDRHVALQLLPPNASNHLERLARFQREALAIAALDHPNVVALHSVEENDGRHFITMQLVQGRTLPEAIPDHGLPLVQLWGLAIPLTDAIAAAHAQGISHCDLKPSNVMVGTDGRIRVLDFGLAKLLSETAAEPAGEAASLLPTQEGRRLGTASCMSPEQAEGKSVDHRSDIFALGILLYEMVTGRRPFDGDTRAATVASILRDRPTPIRELRRDAPERLAQIIHRCLAKAPQQRYQQAIDLRDELSALRDESIGEGPGPSQPGAGRRTIRQEPSSDTELLVNLIRRHRAVAITAGVTLALATLVGAWALWTRNAGAPVLHRITTQLTNVPGPVLGMDWSPHGEFLVFAHISRGSFNIAIKTITGGEWVDLTTTPEDEIDPRWSPDGEWVAYLRDLPGGARIERVRPIPGSEPDELVNTNMRAWAGKAQAIDAMGASPWSPDGEFFLYPQWNESTGATAIYRIDLATRDRSQLTRPGPGVYDRSPSLSPDGQRIVFQRSDSTGQRLWLVGVQDSEAELLFDDELPARNPDWSLDGKRIVFTSVRAGSTDIWEIDVDDPDNPRQVTSAPGIEGQPIVAPTGGIGYYTFEHRSDVYRQRIDEVEAEIDPLVRETPVIDNFGARMSPDGRHAVFYSNRAGNHDLWLLDLASGSPYPAPVPLTTDPSEDILADWSPEGQIVFLSSRDGPYQLWTLDPERPAPVRISDQPIMNYYAGNSFSQGPRVSRDGEVIAYLATAADGNGVALWTISPDGTGARSHDLPGVIWFGWYLDSRRVIYTRLSEDQMRTELWAADLESGIQIPLLHEAVDEIDVAPDGSAVAFQTAVSHISMRLWVLPLTGPDPSDGLPRAMGPPRQLPAASGIWHVHNSSWSWDGDAILYTRDEDEGDVYITEERR